VDLIIEKFEITKQISYATPLSSVFEEILDIFETELNDYHKVRHMMASRCNAKRQALESFRTCEGSGIQRDVCVGNAAFLALAGASGQKRGHGNFYALGCRARTPT